MVAECIRDFVQESEQLKDVTLELNDSFQSDPNLYNCLKELSKDCLLYTSDAADE